MQADSGSGSSDTENRRRLLNYDAHRDRRLLLLLGPIRYVCCCVRPSACISEREKRQTKGEGPLPQFDRLSMAFYLAHSGHDPFLYSVL